MDIASADDHHAADRVSCFILPVRSLATAYCANPFPGIMKLHLLKLTEFDCVGLKEKLC